MRPQLESGKLAGRGIMSFEKRPMKFWELNSVFREVPGLLNEFLCCPEWFQPWGAAFERFDEVVNHQERDILDAVVPLELSRAIARSDKRKWSVSPTGHLRLGTTDGPGEQVLSTLEVHEKFGGWVLEQVLEYGSFRLELEHDAGQRF